MAQRLRVFVSSPGDVKRERLRASLVIDKLAQDYGRFFTIEAYLWEHEPMLSSAHFQDAIEPPSAFDVIVLILWSRLGTPLPEKTALREYRGIDGRAPVTGTEWEYEDALRSARQRGLPDLMVFRNTSHATIDTQDPAARSQAVAQLTALDTFWKLHFTDGGSFRYAFDQYQTLDQFAERLEETLRKVIERRVKTLSADEQRVSPIWLADPFRGLEPYEFEHAPIFFGRDAQITKATEQLAANAAAGSAFLLVCGASGSGKSSLVKAAVVPRMMKPQRITGASFLRRAVFRAGAGGADPFLSLAEVLTQGSGGPAEGLPELIEPGQDAAALAAHLRGAAGNPGYAFGQALGRLTRAGRESGALLSYEAAKLVLVVDQLEELFTVPGIAAETRQAFIALLGGLARSGHVWIIATLRTDFWHRAADIPELVALAEGQGRLDIAAPAPAEQLEIIRKPAMAAGLGFETHHETGLGLDAVLAADAAAAPGVLPILSFTLDELYRDAKKRGSALLTHASYNALGGLEGAIAKRADEVVDGLSEAAQAALPRVLRSLATTTGVDEHLPVSRAAALARFAEGSPARELVDAMVAARLLVADESSAVPTLRLAHEALISHWQRAERQLASDRRDLDTRATVEYGLRRWREAPRSARLLRNPDLANAVDLAKRWADELDAPMREYIARSARHARLAQTLTAAAALVFFLVAVAAVVEGMRAQREEREAERNYLLAIDQAAGSADRLNHGFIEGALNSRLMAELVRRGEETVSKLPGNSDEVSAARAKLLIAMSPAMTAIGDTDKAREYANAAIAIVDDLVKRGPDRFDWRLLWAQSRDALGVALFWGGGDAAIAREKTALAIAELKRLAVSAPDDKLITEKLIAAYENLGDASRSLGDFAGAAAAYTDWLALAEALADKTPDLKQADFWRSYAADAHLRLGDLLQQHKKYEEAAAQYRQGLAIAARINADEPGNAKFLEHLSLGHGKLGDALIAESDLPGAMKEIDLNIRLTDSLVRDLAANIRWLLYQEWSHFRKGRALLALERYEEAYAEFALYLQGVEGMRKRDPAYVSALYDASNAHQWMGDARRLGGRAQDADGDYEEAVRLARETVERSPPTNQAARKILAMAYYRLGLEREAQGRKDEALANYRECAAVVFNHNSFTARSNWPEDVTATCEAKLTELAGVAKP